MENGKSPICEVLADIRAVLDDEKLTLRARCHDLLDQVARLEIAPEDAAEVAARLRQLPAHARELRLLHNDDLAGVLRLLSTTLTSLRTEFANKPPQEPGDEIVRMASQLARLGYSNLEIEELRRKMQRGEKPVGCDVWEVRTNLRVITRLQIREDARPVGFLNRDEWMASFPRLPKREAA